MSALVAILWPSLGVAYALSTLLAIGFALKRRRGFSSTIAWVFAALSLPIAGALAYFLLANPMIKRARRRRHEATLRVREATAYDQLQREQLPAIGAAERSIFEMAERLSGMPASYGNRLQLLTENQRAFAEIERAILEAKKLIWAEYYIVAGDLTGRRFLELLAKRARDGLEVLLLHDAVGSANIDREGVRAILDAGGRVEEFLPVNPLRRRWAVHLRNHRKILVVDGEVGFTGGMNIGDEYSGAARRRVKAWRDSHLMLRGPAVHDLAEIFAEDWYFQTGQTLELPSPSACPGASSIVAALPSGPDQPTNTHGMVYFSGIGAATTRCYLTSPYFVPDEPTARALEAAALRGVDIRVLVPRQSDVPFLRAAMRSYYPQLVETGVRLFEYEPSMLHAKTMVVDGAWGIIGSANLDMRSFRLNFEASVLVHDLEFAKVLEAQFLTDLENSVEITTGWLEARGTLAALGDGAAQLLSPIL